MNNKEKPFWELGLNPITMLRNNDNGFKHYAKVKTQKNSDDISDYATLAEFKETFDLSGWKIRQVLKEFDAIPKRHNGQTYFKRKYFVEFQKTEKPKYDPSMYISNTELMEIFKFSAFKAWDIAKREKLKKVRLRGIKIYYEKKKAIEIFKKYKG